MSDPKKDPTELYHRALDAWGIDSQLDKLAEECSELAAEALRWKAGRTSDDALAEEMVDVQIMLEQMYEITRRRRGFMGLLDTFRRVKLHRLETLLAPYASESEAP